jgi:hypothetical protein
VALGELRRRDDCAEQRAGMADRPARLARGEVVGHGRAGEVDGRSAVGQRQADLEVVGAQHPTERGLEFFGRGAPGAELVEEAAHLPECIDRGGANRRSTRSWTRRRSGPNAATTVSVAPAVTHAD